MSWETIRDLVRDEWLILSLLLLWSLVGLTIICERVYALWNVLPKSEAFKNKVVAAIEAGDLAKATALCETANEPLADVFERGLKMFKKNPIKVTEAVNSQRMVVVGSFRRYLWPLGTVGSSAPFVGLFGTVVGILKAFQSMSVAGAGGFKVVSQGIAAALVATAAGLLVAIYAIVAYNYFVARVNQIAVQYKLHGEEFLTALSEHGPVKAGPARHHGRRPRRLRLEDHPMGMGVNLDDSTAGMDDVDGPESVVAEINITPLTDVFLVLLIIFMVTTTAAVDAEKAAREGVKVALPTGRRRRAGHPKRAVPVLTITTTGELFLFTRRSTEPNLEQELKKALADGNSDTLLLRGDKQVMLGSAVDIMSTAKRAGAKNIGILTQPGK